MRFAAKYRVISTIDTEARHGHKSKNRHFGGYKAQLSIDPDSELICELVATPPNTHDAGGVADLLENEPAADKPIVLGDCAYVDGGTREALGEKGFTLMAKYPPIPNATGGFTNDHFLVDLETNTVNCPAGATIARRGDGSGSARFTPHCGTCPLRSAFTKARAGRQVEINEHEAILQRARAEQTTPGWIATYRRTDHSSSARSHTSSGDPGEGDGDGLGSSGTSPPISHEARAINWARLATLGLSFGPDGWTLAGG